MPTTEKKWTFSRRRFLGLSALAALGTGTGVLGFQAARELTEELLTLTPEEQTWLVHKARQNAPHDFGAFPDVYSNETADPWQQIQNYTQEVSGMREMGWFALLEQIDKPGFREAFKKHIQETVGRGFTPVIALGMGAGFTPHPFDSSNTNLIGIYIDRWITFLNSLDCELVVRWLYEVNTLEGNIAYQKTNAMTLADHVGQYRRLFGMFSQKLHLRGVKKIHLHACFTAAGREIYSYLPDEPFEALDLDIYESSNFQGQMALNTFLNELLHRKEHLFFPNTILLDILGLSQKLGIPANLSEFGSEHMNAQWIGDLLISALGAGYINASLFTVGQVSDSSEGSWLPTPGVLRMVGSLSRQCG